MSTRQYEASLKAKLDTQNAFDSVRKAALKEGAEKRDFEFVKKLTV